MREPGSKIERIVIPYWEGVNSIVQPALARRTELAHMENARAPQIGVLEKREGQITLGTDSTGNEFVTTANYGLFCFTNTYATANQGLFRISTSAGVTGLYVLTNDDRWVIIKSGMTGSNSSFANVNGKMIVVNGSDPNLMVDETLVCTTSATAGSLWNSPIANKVAFYKNRIYLADYTSGTERYKTTVLRSSYPLGIIALVNGDVPVADGATWTIPITDSKYFYTAAGMNSYEVYRGSIKIATVVISSYTDANIISSNVTFEGGYTSFLSSDEIWVTGTYSGAKQYRWMGNPTSSGQDVKQYDTFKLVGGSEDIITMMVPIGNVLLIGNKNTLMTWDDSSLTNFDTGVGCVSKNGYVKLNGSLYFIHYSGIYSTTGAAPQLISRKVERYIKGATATGLEAAAAGYKGLSIFFSIGDVVLYNDDGSTWKTLHKVCLEFNVADQNWYVHTNVSATQFESYIDTAGVAQLAMCSSISSANEALGSELLTNPSFTGSANGWDLGDGWSYNSNSVSFSG
jgi:hypothetical protein